MLLRQSLAYLPGVALPPLFAFLTLVVFTRLLEPAQYGRYALVLASMELARRVGFNWLKLGYLRLHFAAEGEGLLPDLVRSTWLLLLLLLALVAVGIAAAAVLGPWDQPLRLALAAGIGILVTKVLVEQALERYRAEDKARDYSLCVAVFSVSGFLVALLLYRFVLPSELAVIAGVALGYAMVIPVALPRAMRGFGSGRIDPERLRQSFAYGAPLTLSFLLVFVMTTSDRYMIAYFLDEAATGRYAAAYNLGDRIIASLFMLVTMAGLPNALRVFEKQGPQAADNVLRENFSLLLAIGLPSAVVLCLTAAPLADLLLGEGFREAAAEILPWIAATAFLAGFKAHYLDHAFHLGRRTDLLLYTLVPSAAFNIGLNLILIPRFGVIGAAVATLASYVLATVLSLLLGRRVHAVPLPSVPALKTALACLPMVPVLLLPSDGGGPWLLLVALAGAALLYGLAAVMLDLANLRSVVKSMRS